MNRLKITPNHISSGGWCTEEQNQIESIFCQGNGYMGLRAASELSSPLRSCGAFVAGCFDALAGEVSELVMMPDFIGIELRVDGEYMTMEEATEYECRIELETGELWRKYRLETRPGIAIDVSARRIVSLGNKHLCTQQITLTPNRDCCIALTHRLDGSVSNSGAQHMHLIDRRCQVGDCWQLGLKTNQSEVAVALFAAAQISQSQAQTSIAMERRTIGTKYEWLAKAQEATVFTTYIGIHTDRDPDTIDPMQSARVTACEARQIGFSKVTEENAADWAVYWKKHDVKISGSEADQAAMRFALYHLRIMTPCGDERMNIGAKGLSGQAYRGHTFWDTEMFMLMPWMMTNPQVARDLLTYRYLCLPTARRKAVENGCSGALFPWESAWIEDGEQTPDEGEPDVVTGKPIPIYTGKMEIHVNADVALGVWRYYEATGDAAFMDEMGWEILWETGRYWADRAEWNEEKQQYEINHLIGPDEYTEPADNNAYTNYMAQWNMDKAVLASGHLSATDKKSIEKIKRVSSGLYLPQPNQDGIVPQCDGFLQLPMLDITKYKGKPGAILKRYNVEQLSKTQVAKQADVIALMTLLPNILSQERWEANFDYYEARCLHDSSLSYNTYSLAAMRLCRVEEAYELFEKAATVDLAEGMASAEGIHAAAMGGIWQCVVMGFGGVEVKDGQLLLAPALPKAWDELSFQITYQGIDVKIAVRAEQLRVSVSKPLEIMVYGKRVLVLDESIMPC
ncbi:MAG: glycoside hydrolase family 65 protein [Clostridiales bacterium]|nr:glycoside hydrolase family 65 protein [Clostridiales bacterium]